MTNEYLTNVTTHLLVLKTVACLLTHADLGLQRRADDTRHAAHLQLRGVVIHDNLLAQCTLQRERDVSGGHLNARHALW